MGWILDEHMSVEQWGDEFHARLEIDHQTFCFGSAYSQDERGAAHWFCEELEKALFRLIEKAKARKAK